MPRGMNVCEVMERTGRQWSESQEWALGFVCVTRGVDLTLGRERRGRGMPAISKRGGDMTCLI